MIIYQGFSLYRTHDTLQGFLNNEQALQEVGCFPRWWVYPVRLIARVSKKCGYHHDRGLSCAPDENSRRG